MNSPKYNSFKKKGIEDTLNVSGETLQAKRVTSLLHRAYQAFSLYPFDHGIVQEFCENFYTELQSFFLIKSELELRLERFGAYYQKTLILEDKNLVRNFVFLLYSDGVRRLYFYKGIPLEECIELFEILHYCSRNRSLYEDVVTLLWERQFEHINYHLVEDLTESLLPNLSNLYDELEDLEDLALNQKGAQMAVQAATSLSRARLELNEVEQQELKAMIQDEEDGLMMRFFDVISLILEFSEESEELDSLLRLLTHLQPLLLSLDEIDHLVRFFEISQHLITLFSKRHTSQSKKWQTTLQEVMLSATDEKTLQKLIEKLDLYPYNAELKQSIQQYINLLISPSIEPLLKGFIWSKSPETKVFWSSVLALKYRDNPRQLLHGIRHENATIVRLTCQTLGLIRNPDALPLLDKATQHSNPHIRTEALKAVFQIDANLLSEIRMRNILESRLKDSDQDVRITAITGLLIVGKHGYFPIQMALNDNLYEHWSEEENVLFFKAVAKLSSIYPNLVEQLSQHLIDKYKGLFSGLRNQELAKLALEALYIENTSTTKKAFSYVNKKGSRSLRRICEEIVKFYN